MTESSVVLPPRRRLRHQYGHSPGDAPLRFGMLALVRRNRQREPTRSYDGDRQELDGDSLNVGASRRYRPRRVGGPAAQARLSALLSCPIGLGGHARVSCIHPAARDCHRSHVRASGEEKGVWQLSSYEACIKGNQKLGNIRNIGAWCSLKCAGCVDPLASGRPNGALPIRLSRYASSR